MNTNLYVANIPPKATKEDLEKTFGEFGEIDSIKLDEDENSSSKKNLLIKNSEMFYSKKSKKIKKLLNLYMESISKDSRVIINW